MFNLNSMPKDGWYTYKHTKKLFCNKKKMSWCSKKWVEKYFFNLLLQGNFHLMLVWWKKYVVDLTQHQLHICLLIPRWETRNEEFENEEFFARKTDEKNEKMRDQKSSILEAFGGGNDTKFKIIFSYSAKSTLKWFLRSKIWLI